MIFFLFLKIYPYLFYNSPIGIDTGRYLLSFRILEKETQISLSNSNLGPSISYLFTFLPIIPLRAFGISWEIIIAVYPILIGIIYILSNYFFVKLNTNNVIGLFTVVFSAFSLTVQILTSVTYRNGIALSIFTLIFLFYLNYINYKKKKDLIFLILFFIYLFIQYPWMAIIIFPIMILFIILNIFSKSLRSSTKDMIIPLMSFFFIIIIISLLFNILSSIKIYIHFLNISKFFYEQLIIYIYDLKIENMIPEIMVSYYNTPFYSYFLDSPLLLICAMIGILSLLISTCLDKKTILLRNLIFSWLIIISFIIIINLKEGYRLVLNYPLPIFSAFGLNFLISFFSIIHIKTTSYRIKFKIIK